MKVLLVNPPAENVRSGNPDEEQFLDTKDFGLFPPLGLLYVYSYLEAHSQGHELHFHDCVGEKLSHQDLRLILRQIKPDIVGVTSFTVSLIDVIEVARMVREESPQAHICMGGHHPIAFPIEAAQTKEFDSIIVGEGEYAFTDLVRAIESGGDITQIEGVYTAKSILPYIGQPMAQDRRFLQSVMVPPAYVDNLDDLPPPNRKLIRQINYHSTVGVSGNLATIITTRGCPYLCAFCDVPYKKYRQRSVDLVLDEVQQCLDMGYDEFHFYDDLFNVNPRKVIEFCDAVERRGMKFAWDFRGRVNAVTRESLERAKRAGLRQISFGVETGTNEGLDYLKKGTNVQQIRDAFRWCRELGIRTVADYILGFPFEKSADDVRRNIDFLIDLDPDYALFSILQLLPNTALYREAVAKGLVKDGSWEAFSANPSLDFKVEHWTEHLSLAELIALRREAYRKLYLRPSYILRNILQTRTPHEFMLKFRGFLLLLGGVASSMRHRLLTSNRA
ncbi:MAG: B12-binding domain-containing radical SAM protein [Alphaproteobacteria bacterium]|nr:B12-binding domain-containing radical SAM protein [Alphaproteobacteria bacterium]